MKQFNYKKAWIEMAAPAYEALSPEAVTLIAETIVASAGLSQKADLDMPWPEGLREMFEKVGPLELAKAARTIHQFGHWRPFFNDLNLFDLRGTSIEKSYEDATQLLATGGYWKFANYADQVLTERLGIPRDRTGPHGVSHVVMEGALRAYLATPRLWTHEEIGWAVPEMAHHIDFDGELGPTSRESEEAFGAHVKKLRKVCEGDGFKEATNISRFMEES